MGRIAGQRPLSTVEILQREMLAAGDRLLIALTVEAQFGKIKAGDDWKAIEKQWKECRWLIGQFAEDYAVAIERWRTAVQESAKRAPLRGTSSTFFQQLIEDGAQRFRLHR
jgi:hypothetical protein